MSVSPPALYARFLHFNATYAFNTDIEVFKKCLSSSLQDGTSDKLEQYLVPGFQEGHFPSSFQNILNIWRHWCAPDSSLDIIGKRIVAGSRTQQGFIDLIELSVPLRISISKDDFKDVMTFGLPREAAKAIMKYASSLFFRNLPDGTRAFFDVDSETKNIVWGPIFENIQCIVQKSNLKQLFEAQLPRHLLTRIVEYSRELGPEDQLVLVYNPGTGVLTGLPDRLNGV
eukprot:GILJ01004009.1.p1 GENE.GILJ01004009.1~~GILJ01004009.1.p1  ORF type:complete len:238 (-),score=13.08 GILJ01004009.1:262-945(-)